MGYIGTKMSERAMAAHNNGEKPYSQWSKEDLLDCLPSAIFEQAKKLTLSELKSELLYTSSWHHTGSYFNNTDFYSLDEDFIELSKDGYPELEEKKDYILKFISIEEDNFNKTIEQGLSKLDNLVKDLVKSGKKELAGEDAFRLYDTFGFPLDLTTEILEEKGIAFENDHENQLTSLCEIFVAMKKMKEENETNKNKGQTEVQME